MSSTSKEILEAARERRCKSGRHERGGGDRGLAESDYDEGSDDPRYDGTDTGDAHVL